MFACFGLHRVPRKQRAQQQTGVTIAELLRMPSIPWQTFTYTTDQHNKAESLVKSMIGMFPDTIYHARWLDHGVREMLYRCLLGCRDWSQKVGDVYAKMTETVVLILDPRAPQPSSAGDPAALWLSVSQIADLDQLEYTLTSIFERNYRKERLDVDKKLIYAYLDVVADIILEKYRTVYLK